MVLFHAVSRRAKSIRRRSLNPMPSCPKEVAFEFLYEDESDRRQLEELIRKPFDQMSDRDKENGMYLLDFARQSKP